MFSRIPPRVFGLAFGLGALVAGLVMALLGAGVQYIGLVAGGLVIAAMGLLAAIVGAIGFALHGSARSERYRTKRT
ncbi:hypothetical protein JYQ29_08590 [Curtobacterium flaccumfaciens pv. flaccumfaciens]|uniref:hypothetical protein n=1 Tax=Curtobacterium flaccumfaciens TaxID=2035 RepID=UPI001ADA2C88|nr:hypothetical protein [Curtobacterium flaccumfaciens]MBO9047061.1 hypothetical protein [Curtobacterium flaccumfaciens pv. flaccumfaciens]MBO9057041.1 hypothetical protein [Curtobacterium flaccumfaciens pv. flaccumfaciens]QTR91902.1 hypothetical protein JG550_001204 [Curtobacterium flaccumfaciens pv. flaccumfaciens]QVG67206.1 hypothetical protein JG551_001192 [Curtobacterium flaccumfaciens pv. flaccumfaciens]